MVQDAGVMNPVIISITIPHHSTLQFIIISAVKVIAYTGPAEVEDGLPPPNPV